MALLLDFGPAGFQPAGLFLGLVVSPAVVLFY
jgi:hypothetical protein